VPCRLVVDIILVSSCAAFESHSLLEHLTSEYLYSSRYSPLVFTADARENL
jgi:hypothetical protein